MRRLLSARTVRTGFGCLLFAASAFVAATAEAWTLDEALGLPDRLQLRFEHRLRYERLDDQFRPLPGSDDDILVLRTLVDGRLRLFDWLTLGAEFEDSRGLAGEDTGVIDTTIVNTAELLRAYLEVGVDDVLGGRLEAQAGRITMDVGSRRLVARNRYRNTINGFTGIAAEWQGPRDVALRAFWTLPVQRLPAAADELRDNHVKFDHEGFAVQFWGLASAFALPGGIDGEVQLFGLHEDDSSGRPTRDRELYTPAIRIYRSPAPGAFDFEVETAFQAGHSRASTTSTQDLDHFAHFHHAEAGYTFDAPWQLRVAIEYDYASGDDDPDDDDNGRFDTLYGARRFDFGPTGIYGPFARSNLSTPGIRLAAKPCDRLDGFVAFRSYWLASKRDAWTTTGIADPGGDSGRYLGSQFELRLRARILPENLVLETGYAHLFAGEFMRDAPGSPARGDADYLYAQLALRY